MPPAARDAVDAALRAGGLEVTRSAVRVPARAQLIALLEGAPAIDEKGLAARLACVTGPETKALVASLMQDGRLLRIERPTGTALVLPSARTFDGDRASRLAEELARALKWVRRAAKAGLLERDVAELIARLGGAAEVVPLEAASRGTGSTSLLDLLARTAVKLAAEHGGLASVPTLVRSVDAPTAKVHAALLEGHARGWFELQPESSMGRLGAEELALCLPGPEGTRLSWVRPLVRPVAAKVVTP